MNYLAEGILAIDKAKYEREKNPRYVWDAISVICGGNFEFPEWVKAYLYRVAKSMIEESKKTGTKDDDIVGILEFKDLRQLNDPDMIGTRKFKVMKLMYEK